MKFEGMKSLSHIFRIDIGGPGPGKGKGFRRTAKTVLIDSLQGGTADTTQRSIDTFEGAPAPRTNDPLPARQFVPADHAEGRIHQRGKTTDQTSAQPDSMVSQVVVRPSEHCEQFHDDRDVRRLKTKSIPRAIINRTMLIRWFIETATLPTEIVMASS